MVGVGESGGGRGSKGGRMSDGGMREWCGVEEEEEQWSSPGACRRPYLFISAGRHSCAFVFIRGRLLFVRRWSSLFVVVVVGDRGCQWGVVSSSVGAGHSWVGHGHPWALNIHGMGGRGGQWGGRLWALEVCERESSVGAQRLWVGCCCRQQGGHLGGVVSVGGRGRFHPSESDRGGSWLSVCGQSHSVMGSRGHVGRVHSCGRSSSVGPRC